MSDNRRNRRYSKYKEKSKEDAAIQPKILLRERDPPATSSISQTQVSIATRDQPSSSSDITQSQSQSPNAITIQTKEPNNIQVNQSIQNAVSAPIEPMVQPVPIMSKPITILSLANNQVNPNTTKVLMKNNTDFLVVGIIGGQGVGKSTILNLLASSTSGSDFSETGSTESNSQNIFKTFFKNKEGVFPTKFKPGKGPSTPRTESLHMFITKDRLILLDGPPVLSNPGKKDATTNELEDIDIIILLLSVCHLLIVVQDDYFDMNLIRLLQFAELSKPCDSESKLITNEHLPNILFVKNRAKRCDFLPQSKARYEKIFKYIFKDSQLKIYFGQTENKKKIKSIETESVNYFIFPEVSELGSTHSTLEVLMDDFRQRVFMTPRNPIFNGEFNEALWFEIFTVTSLNKNEFFLPTYEEIRRLHTNTHNDQNM